MCRRLLALRRKLPSDGCRIGEALQ
jgi:hypothetical protein